MLRSSLGRILPRGKERTKQSDKLGHRSYNVSTPTQSQSKPLKGDKNAILFWALKHQTTVTLRELMEFGQNPTRWTLLMSAQFLQRELPIRLAKRIRELQKLPHGLAEMPSILKLLALYEQSFWAINEFDDKIKTLADEENFTQELDKMLQYHSPAREYIADGIQELFEQRKIQQNPLPRDVDLKPYLGLITL